MKYYINTFLFFLITPILSHAAEARVSMSSRYNEQTKSYDLIADSNVHGTIILEVSFTKAINVKCKDGTNPFKKMVRYGTNTITSISKRDPNYAVDFGYKFTWSYGCFNKEVEPEYPYSIPLANGAKTELREMTYIGSKYGNETDPEGWYAVTLATVVGDTIYASRRGIVNLVSYSSGNNEQTNLSFASKRNRLTIQHKDCSQASYALFKDRGIFVKEGDNIEVGQPIGIIDGSNYDMGSHLRFSVNYYNTQSERKVDKKNSSRSNQAFIRIKFHTSDGVKTIEPNEKFTAVIDPNLITKEMSKRQYKKWLKSQ